MTYGTRRTSKAASRTTGSGARGRPIGKLRTIDEAAEDVLNTSSRTVRRLIESGALRVYRIGRLVRISDADLQVFLDENCGD
jgi:excisionase family DNA binding protein